MQDGFHLMEDIIVVHGIVVVFLNVQNVVHHVYGSKCDMNNVV
jgi:hypothetical protein